MKSTISDATRSYFAPFAKTAVTVDSALAQFNKVLTDLRTVKAVQDAEEKRQQDIASAAVTASNVAQREAVRAAKAIVKIESFLDL